VRREGREYEAPPQRLHFRREVEPKESAERGRVSFLKLFGPFDAEQRHEDSVSNVVRRP
jgi:hypothetical protein